MLKKTLEHLKSYYGNRASLAIKISKAYGIKKMITFCYTEKNINVEIYWDNNIYSGFYVYKKHEGFIFSIQIGTKIKDIEKLLKPKTKKYFLELARELKDILKPSSIKFIESL